MDGVGNVVTSKIVETTAQGKQYFTAKGPSKSHKYSGEYTIQQLFRAAKAEWPPS